jgi:SAM-dependent methyltransferase
MGGQDIVKVDKQRWQVAQEWEREHWKTVQRAKGKFGKNVIWKLLSLSKLTPSGYWGDDWNHWWKRQFQNYHFLPKNVENTIELGCGPFTNVRLIVDTCEIKHLFLSDPLIRDYVRFKSSFVGQMYRSGKCFIDDHPIEDNPFASNYFDLVIMINVLDHVWDAELCMRKAIDIVRTGGILIIGQDLTDEVDMRQPGVKNDPGHPIRVGHHWIDRFLHRRFNKIIYRILPRELGRNPEAHYGTYIFAGKKLS